MYYTSLTTTGVMKTVFNLYKVIFSHLLHNIVGRSMIKVKYQICMIVVRKRVKYELDQRRSYIENIEKRYRFPYHTYIHCM